ncbi:transposase [Anaerocolumna sedimenticola]|uniref:transposase n=1 Tax=Anaerocolumna sedimenticola TaxID=2696063 RepID=UPI001FEB5F82|nr:transposase [Anaerocolumna sedimenticola]
MQHESPHVLKKNLSNIISAMQASSDLFVKQPGKDFIRNRKLTFSQSINFFLCMGGNTIRKELLDFFNYDSDCVSSSAFSQQRAMILPEAIDFLFHSFTESFTQLATYQGFRLIACDGSDLAITYNPKDMTTYRRHNSIEKNEKGYNQLHLNALYDLENRIYLDAIIQPGRHPNETQALRDMMEHSKLDERTILMADRGYESYNILAHAQEKGWNYLIRVKDLGSHGILTNLPLPDTEEFDCKLSLILTKKQTKEIKAHPEQYRYLTNNKFPRQKGGVYPARNICPINPLQFCERVTTGIIIQQKKTKYIYQINFAIAVVICKQFYKDRISPPTVEALIQKNVIPVGEGRKAPRKVRPNSAVSFLYRIA